MKIVVLNLASGAIVPDANVDALREDEIAVEVAGNGILYYSNENQDEVRRVLRALGFAQRGVCPWHRLRDDAYSSIYFDAAKRGWSSPVGRL